MDYGFVRDMAGRKIGVMRLSDMACIPLDEANSDYARFVEWVAEGGVPGEWSPPE